MQRFNSGDYAITVYEDASEGGAGRAPEPGIATLTSTGESSRVKRYVLILNPTFVLPKGMNPLPYQPATPADMMAAAWAGEIADTSGSRPICELRAATSCEPAGAPTTSCSGDVLFGGNS